MAADVGIHSRNLVPAHDRPATGDRRRVMGDSGEKPTLLRRANRIPLDIVVTATGERTSGVMVCVLAADLDAYEERLMDLNNLAASVASHYEDRDRGMDVASQEPELHDEANALWDRTWPATSEFENAAEADERASVSGSSEPSA